MQPALPVSLATQSCKVGFVLWATPKFGTCGTVGSQHRAGPKLSAHSADRCQMAPQLKIVKAHPHIYWRALRSRDLSGTANINLVASQEVPSNQDTASSIISGSTPSIRRQQQRQKLWAADGMAPRSSHSAASGHISGRQPGLPGEHRTRSAALQASGWAAPRSSRPQIPCALHALPSAH